MIKTVFFGTPDFAAEILEALHRDEDIFVSAVVCQPDKPSGRKKELSVPATKQFALENDIPVLQPTSLKEGLDVGADVFVVVAYGNIIPKNVLDIPKHGSINVHPSLLPKYRGPSPMKTAIVNQDEETGVSIMLLDEKMDHGPILAQERFALDSDETAHSLQRKVVDVATPLLLNSIKGHLNGSVTPVEQNHKEATRCHMLTRDDGVINWNESAAMIYAKVRAYNEWPGTMTVCDNKALKIHSVALTQRDHIDPGLVDMEDRRLFVGTSSSPLEILELQLEGKQRIDAKTFLNGHQDCKGKQLG